MEDESESFATLKECLSILGFSLAHQDLLFSTAWSILLMGNIQFKMGVTGRCQAHQKSDRDLVTICEGLGIEPFQLIDGMTVKSIQSGSHGFESFLSVGECEETRDALARAIYANLFRAIVDAITISLTRCEHAISSTQREGGGEGRKGSEEEEEEEGEGKGAMLQPAEAGISSPGSGGIREMKQSGSQRLARKGFTARRIQLAYE